MAANRAKLAERLFRGIYGGDPTVVDELASEDIVSSYPIFERLFDTPAIRGRAAVKKFASGFSERWADPQIDIHESITEGDRVVLLWSFQARNVGAGPQGTAPSGQVHQWGGLTLFRFNSSEQIVAEIGEESSPGPFKRSTVKSVV